MLNGLCFHQLCVHRVTNSFHLSIVNSWYCSETHSNVTVFFSDIVRFTDISRALSPVKVCNMLDRLYLAFDALANKHEVFKLETIGDAWVGVTNREYSSCVACIVIDGRLCTHQIFESTTQLRETRTQRMQSASPNLQWKQLLLQVIS